MKLICTPETTKCMRIEPIPIVHAPGNFVNFFPVTYNNLNSKRTTSYFNSICYEIKECYYTNFPL